MKKILYFISLIVFTLSLSAKEIYEKGKIIDVLQKVEAKEWEEELDYTQVYKVEVRSGKDKGKILQLEMPFYKEKAYNLILKNKVEVMLYRDSDSNEYFIVDRVRSKSILVLIGIFIILVVAVAKYNGLKALISLASTIFFLIYVFVPLIIRGWSPIISALILCVFSSLITIFSIGAISKKSLCALMGTLGGVSIASILSIIFVNLTGLTGFTDVETMNYAFLFENINLRELISAGIIIGSLGATMDIGVSISSALFEINSHNDELSKIQIFKSGLNIGKDIIGTMVNTLILAYLGSSVFTIILFLKQRSDFPLIRILNSEFIVVEILRAFTGSIGILIAVPFTSYVASILISKLKTSEKEIKEE